MGGKQEFRRPRRLENRVAQLARLVDRVLVRVDDVRARDLHELDDAEEGVRGERVAAADDRAELARGCVEGLGQAGGLPGRLGAGAP